MFTNDEFVEKCFSYYEEIRIMKSKGMYKSALLKVRDLYVYQLDYYNYLFEIYKHGYGNEYKVRLDNLRIARNKLGEINDKLLDANIKF